MHRAAIAPLSAPTAWVGASLALALVVYASLYPFEGWREESPALSQWLLSPWPRYWTGWDLWVNWLGYLPLGAAWGLAVARRHHQYWRVLLVGLGLSGVSLVLESIQSLMVHRVASNLDWALNSLGALCGAWLMVALLRSRWPLRWQAWREAYLLPGAGLVLLLLGLWLLLLPLPMLLPFALGRLPPEAVAGILQWLPEPVVAGWEQVLPLHWGALSDSTQVAAITLTLVTPVAMLRFGAKDWRHRIWAAWLMLACAVWVPTLAHAINYGWSHAGDWLLPAVVWALVCAAAVAPVLMVLPRSVLATLVLLLLVLQWLGVNILAETGYWSFHWQAFAQGRFIRWYGLLGWLAVVWPALAVALVWRSLSKREK